MDFPYIFILVTILIVSPFILALASKQGKQAKQNLKYIFLTLLLSQILLGFLNWENFQGTGRSGFDLSLAYPGSFLGLFFIISLLQITLLVLNKPFNKAVAVFNFINSLVIFAGMIRLSSLLEKQIFSLPSIGAVFLVLIGNVISLMWINRDKNLLKKYPF
ncbi:MAG: hypothetical protein Q7S45_00995 [Candidatus Curtissbacteria bacterium]|nr:hypothetical protein [Candidatus Curtissbacteria bacterium]